MFSVKVVYFVCVAVQVVALVCVIAAVWTKSVAVVLWADPDGFCQQAVLVRAKWSRFLVARAEAEFWL